MSDRKEGENKAKRGGQGEEDEKDQINLASFFNNLPNIVVILLKDELQVCERACVL